MREKLESAKKKTISQILGNTVFSIIGLIVYLNVDMFLTSAISLSMVVLGFINIVINLTKFYSTYKLIYGINNKSYEEKNADLKKILEELEEQLKEQQRRQRLVDIKQNSVLNAYKLLKVNKSDDIDVIKKSYRTFAKKWHPDKFTNDTDENKRISANNIQKLNNAYSIIKKDKNFN